MTDLSFSLALSTYKTSLSVAGRSLVSVGADGVRLVSGLAPHYTLGTAASLYSDFYNDAYTNGIINGIEGYAPQTITSVEYKLHLVAGETLALDYDFIPGDKANNDFAFALLADGQGNITSLLLADVQHWIDGGHATHYTGATFHIGATGDYKLLIASADAGDSLAPSALILHSLQVQVPFGNFTLLPNALRLNADASLLTPTLLTPGSASALSSLQTALAANLISQDGGGLISQDGGGFKLADGTALISQDGGGLISQDGGGLISQDGGGLVASGGGNLTFVAGDLSTLAQQTAAFNNLQASSLVASGAGNLVASGAGNLVAQGAGNLVASGGGNLSTRTFVAVAPLPAALHDAPILETELLVSPAAAGFGGQDSPVIAALSNGRFVVAWVQTSLTGVTSIHARLMNSDRSNFGTTFQVSSLGEAGAFQPSVTALSDGTFAIGWSSIGTETMAGGGTGVASDIHVAFYEAAGQLVSVHVIASTGNQNQPALTALAGGGALLVFTDTSASDGTGVLRAQLFDTSYVASGGSTALSDGNSDASTPAIAMLQNGGTAVAYADVSAGGQTAILLRIDRPGGSSVAQVSSVTSAQQHWPTVISLANGNLVVAWVDEDSAGEPVASVRAQVMTAAGAPIGPPILVTALLPSQSGPPGLTVLNDGRIVVTWTEANVSSGAVVATSVRAEAFNADGTASTASFAAATGGSNLSQPGVAQLADGTLVVASVHTQGSSSDVRVSPLEFSDIEVLPCPVAAGSALLGVAAGGTLDQRAGAVAGLSSGKSVAVWQSDPIGNGGRFQIEGQMLDATGMPVGSVFVVSTPDFFDQITPTVTGLAGGGFVVGWADRHFEDTANGDSTRDFDVRARIYGADGLPLGSLFIVNSVVVRTQQAPAFASLWGGGFVATWTSTTAVAGTRDVVAQRFAADGTRVGGEVQVGASIDFSMLSAPAAAGLQNGGFVVAYARTDLVHPEGSGLWLQMFGAGGSPSNAVLVQASVDPQLASVATLANGSFVVTWANGAGSGTVGTGIVGTVRAQVFSAAGVALGGSVVVAINADVAVDAPAVAGLADGRFMIAYDSYDAASHSETVRARVYNPDGSAAGEGFAASTQAAGIRASHPAIVQLASGVIAVISTQGDGGELETAGFTPGDLLTSDIHLQDFTVASAPRGLIRGQLADGYIQGALVFADANGDGLYTPGEQSAVTGAHGEFFFTGDARGPIIARGGVDQSTGIPFTGTLTAPSGSTTVSALTTLVQKIMVANGGDQGAAIASVAAAFGLPADAELTTFDPVQATLDHSATALASYSVNALLFTVIGVASDAGAPGDLLGALATQVLEAPPGLFDPTTPEVLLALGLDPVATVIAAAVLADAKVALDLQVANSADDPAALLAGVTGIQQEAQGITPVVACFLRGTTIQTERGPVAVEALRTGTDGDWAITASGHAARITWVGWRRVALRGHPRPWDIDPVRVRTGAIAPGMPARDLLLSPDHAIFMAGVLIPVRYLINGAGIVQEHGRLSADYFHVELDVHDVLLAHGLPTESYLDTGGKAMFSGDGAVQLQAEIVPADARAMWEIHACAKLVLDGPLLARARADLLVRSQALGYRLTADAGLHILADGVPIWPTRTDGCCFVFDLPPARSLRLRSRAAAPAEVDAWSSDRRRLGVAVGSLLADRRVLAPGGLGWHAPEAGWSWTDGDAELAAPGTRTLTVGLALPYFYWENECTDLRNAA
jgi:hypothetical protein